MNLNDNGTEIQSQIANMTKTGLTILSLSHFNKLSTTKGRSATNIRCQEMCKQPRHVLVKHVLRNTCLVTKQG